MAERQPGNAAGSATACLPILIAHPVAGVFSHRHFHAAHIPHDGGGKPQQDGRGANYLGLPTVLLLMALPIFPILWGGVALELPIAAEYFPLAVPLATGSTSFAIIAFVGGLSAATGAMVGIALALSTMILNHWILPATTLRTKRDIYRQIMWLRRILILVVLLFGFGSYLVLNNRYSLTELALPAFILTLQLLPGVIGVTHWSRGNSLGFISGLLIGTAIWLIWLMIPMVLGVHSISLPGLDRPIRLGASEWDFVTLWSIGLNTLVFISVSCSANRPMKSATARRFARMMNSPTLFA